MARRGDEMTASRELSEDIFSRMESATGRTLDGVVLVTIAEEGLHLSVWGMVKKDGQIRGVMPDAAVALLIEAADEVRGAT